MWGKSSFWVLAILCAVAGVAMAIHGGPAKYKSLPGRPIDYFDKKCARCHGPGGSFYGAEFGKGLTDAKLRAVVKRMCDGPAQAPLAEPLLSAQVAYHRSIINRQPFVAWVGMENGAMVIETAPDATVTAREAGKQLKVTQSKDGTWRVLSGTHNIKGVSVTVKNASAETTMRPALSPYSHNRPLEAK